MSPGDPMDVAGAKVFRFHFQRLLRHEPGALLGEDPEELHDMRVATRRLRAALRLFGPYLPETAVSRLTKGLRRTGRALGPARDLDVLLANAAGFAAALPEERRGEMEPLLEHWRTQRERERQRMLDWLSDERYDRFKARAEELLQDDGRGPRLGDAPRLYLVFPGLLWDLYQGVRAYESRLDPPEVATLHALRIAGKRLRYALEFAREALGEAGEALIRRMKEAQDHLGAMHDADVAVGLIEDYLRATSPAGSDSADTAGSAAAVRDYLARRARDRDERTASFPQMWEMLVSPETRSLLGQAAAAL